MKTKQALIVTCALSVACCVMAASPSPADLRAKAKDLFGTLPDKMPGSENDTPARVELGRTTCHVGPAMGGNSYQKVGLVHPYETADIGRAKVTNEDSDKTKFKLPSLRNVAITGPNFHDGKITTVKEAMTNMAYHQLDKKLTEQEGDSIVVFLHALTDKPRALVD